jgi:putative hydrolase
MLSDYHTHTVYSHGSGSIEDNVLAARAKGIMTIGITDHGPGHLLFGLDRKDIPKARAEIELLRTKYPDMSILFGVEANIINKSGILDVRPEEFSDYDFVIAGYHYGVAGKNPVGSTANHLRNIIEYRTGVETKSLMRRNTRNIVRALERNSVKILTHPGDKAPVDLLEIAVVCAKTDTLIEINTWHSSLSAEDIRTMALTDAKFVISSDAHTPARIGDFISGINLALDAGLEMSRVVNVKTTPVERIGS